MSTTLKNILEQFKKDGMMIAVGITMMALLCFITYASIYVELKNKEVVLMLFGTISGYAGGILTYYFGSSKGSSDKNKLLAESTTQKP